MVLMVSALADDSYLDPSTYFFGYIGVASALVFASNVIVFYVRPRCCLRNRQVRSWHLLHGCFET